MQEVQYTGNDDVKLGSGTAVDDTNTDDNIIAAISLVFSSSPQPQTLRPRLYRSRKTNNHAHLTHEHKPAKTVLHPNISMVQQKAKDFSF